MRLAFAIDSVPFTQAVIAGETSLGGSESACLALARALAKRGHSVSLFATKLDPSAVGKDAYGCHWRPAEDLAALHATVEWDALIVLRAYFLFHEHARRARLRLVWNEDLMAPPMVATAMACAWQVDQWVYVSDFHQRQWEQAQPDLKGFGWATVNPVDLSLIPTSGPKDPSRLIHISRPERGLQPLLAMWPAFRKAHPHATLAVCRYSSMYDAGGWGQVCRAYDTAVDEIGQAAGGIVRLGELSKAQLYAELSKAAGLWYPGVVDFAETSCIAAIEAQACGTPVIASFKGALPETAEPSWRQGLLIDGDATTDAYREASMAAAGRVLDGCQHSRRWYRDLQEAGRAHAQRYGADLVAAQWEAHLNRLFVDRFQANPIGVVRQLMHDDDYVSAREAITVARGIASVPQPELGALMARCETVIDGEDYSAELYAANAVQDPAFEAKASNRLTATAKHFGPVSHVLDVACGNGAFALAMAAAHPATHITGVDYSAANIAAAKQAAEAAGIADRVRFEVLEVYDYRTHELSTAWYEFARNHGGEFDALFVGEFLEHCANTQAVIDGLERVLRDGSRVIYTVPNGPLGSDLRDRTRPDHRGHVHCFTDEDLDQLFGQRADYGLAHLAWGTSDRGAPCGNWVVGYTTSPQNPPSRRRDLASRISRTRPLVRLSIGMIVKDVEADLTRCLSAAWRVADEIVIGDTGSTDRTKAIAAEFGARVIDLPPIETLVDGFSEARNRVLEACTGDWFFWLDADEVLVHQEQLRKYLAAPSPFRGVALHQNHLTLDLPLHFDKPVRLFRRDPSIRFFGCVHEQPGDGDANTDIIPALLVDDVAIAHFGYLNEEVRRGKMFGRNLPLLVRDRERFPDRRLGLVLVLRDYINIADHSREAAGGEMTAQALACYQYAAALFREQLADPTDKLHDLARPWYERALKALNVGYEMEVALAGKAGGMGNLGAQVTKHWVVDAAELRRLVDARVATIEAGMVTQRMHVDPFPETLAALAAPSLTDEPEAAGVVAS